MSQHDVLTRFSRDMGGSMEPDENGSWARMKHSDVEELARKANLAQMNNAPEGVFIVDAQALSLFAALVLEKAAEVCDAEANNWDDDKGLIVCAKAIRRMSADLQSGERG